MYGLAPSGRYQLVFRVLRLGAPFLLSSSTYLVLRTSYLVISWRSKRAQQDLSEGATSLSSIGTSNANGHERESTTLGTQASRRFMKAMVMRSSVRLRTDERRQTSCVARRGERWAGPTSWLRTPSPQIFDVGFFPCCQSSVTSLARSRIRTAGLACQLCHSSHARLANWVC